MGKLFGTDGIRGVVNAGLDAQLAFKVGQATAVVLSRESGGTRPLVTIGKDTRISSDLLEGALIAGLCSSGANVLSLGVIPTPAVAYLTIRSGAQAGVVISASHNPFEHNGIKIFNGQGFKLSDLLEEEIENIVLSDVPIPLKTHGDLGKVIHAEKDEVGAYVNHLVSSVGEDLAGLRILVDCANGAASATAEALFSHFPKLYADIIHASPDGVNINAQCGSTHMEDLCSRVRTGGYNLGIAFDGDADRCLVCDEEGNLIDGDQIMAVCGRDMKERGELPDNMVVATVMSNLGFHVFCRENGLAVFCTDVGDRNVLEKMEECGYRLGGEQSGHMIFRDFATTGDGQLTALQLLRLMHSSGRMASELTSDCKRFPQILVNVSVADPAKKEEIMASSALSAAVAEQEILLGGEGRILVRPSGTEALIRVMVEAKEEDTARACAEILVNVVKLL